MTGGLPEIKDCEKSRADGGNEMGPGLHGFSIAWAKGTCGHLGACRTQ